MQNVWTGFHYDGQTAAKEPVTIHVTGVGLHVAREDGITFLWPFEDLKKTHALGTEKLRVELRSGEDGSLAVTEEGLPEAIAGASPTVARRLGNWSPLFDSSSRSTFVKVAIGAATVATLYFLGLPALATLAAPHVPVAWEVELGRAMAERLVPVDERCGDHAARAAVDQIVQRLVASVPDSPYEFHVTLANDSTINAFAAPGGYIVVNRGLLEATETPEELAGVLGHEIQHVLRRHSVKGTLREIPLRVAVSTIGGGSDAVGAVAARAVGSIGALRYRRGDEMEADREGMKMLQAARVNPRGMIDFFLTLSRRRATHPTLISYLSTHPKDTRRIASLERLAEESRYQPVPLLPGTAWSKVKVGCRN